GLRDGGGSDAHLQRGGAKLVSSIDGEIQLVTRHEDLIEVEGAEVRRAPNRAAIEPDRDLHHAAVAGKKLPGDMRRADETRGCRPAKDGRLCSRPGMEREIAGRHTVYHRTGGVEQDSGSAITAEVTQPGIGT